jgi:hypothetical protein
MPIATVTSQGPRGPERGEGSAPVGSAARCSSSTDVRLTPEEHRTIKNSSSQLRIPLERLKQLTDRNAKLREQLVERFFDDPKGLFARCATWFAGRFISKGNLPSTREQLEKDLSDNIKSIRSVTKNFLQPSIDKLRKEYEGKTFVRTKDTPRPLVLASVPSQKVGKIPSHAALFEAIAHFAQKTDQPSFKVVSRDDDNSITITRRNQDGYEETIRLSYRREGKVNAEIIGPYGSQSGGFWNDDAFKLINAFAKGRPMILRPAHYKEYTVVE